jgi:DNA-damage-inducible protein J
MDEALKRDFETVCGEMGLTMTMAFTVFAKAVSSGKEIPFRLKARPMVIEIANTGEMGVAKEWLRTEMDEARNGLNLKIPRPDCMKGQICMSDDFDAPLDDFKEYM